ncbi:hypothetical protein [Polyangium mundeleinium]|uniref:Tetratricopeptide repeat protein n=1 Tax=Polyangium mundeleinium TaxID=2995306 RepID=A0ABT5EGF9_9BACT|nr:hypothetical protein [Polyangium mundeleinium]MDC0740910.1 hypothetical protein [Polyangium mundeleinium]
MAEPDRYREVIKALRLLEHAPDNRRPFFLFDEPFEDAHRYFTALTQAITTQYEQLRGGIGAEGIELPRLGPLPPGDASHRAAVALAHVAEFLAPHLDGVLVGLLPRHVSDGPGFLAAVQAWLRLPFPPGVRCAVLDESRSVKNLDAEARFIVPEGPLFGFVNALPAEAAMQPLRAALLSAAQASATREPQAATGAYEDAVELCRGRGLARELGGVLMALGAAALARGAQEDARRRFTEAALHAECTGLPAQAAAAWMAVGSLAAAVGLQEVADKALEAARAAAERGGIASLREHVERLHS